MRFTYKSNQRGQSLTEVALFLPMFLILLAGVVEISQMMITANRVSSVVRESTRFGAGGGEDTGMSLIALNTITQTMPIDSARWDIFSIRGVVNESGTGINEWEFNHIYGDGNTTNFADVSEADIRAEVLDNLQSELDGSLNQSIAADVQFVGTVALFDAESILGLNTFVEDLFTIRDIAVMRTFPTTPSTNGCDAFPIAVEEGIRSLGGENSSQFPDPSDFTYPTSNQPTLDDFSNHQPNVPLLEAQPGYVYFIQNGDGQGNFGWLTWNEYISSNAVSLEENLTWPGKSGDYTDLGNPANLPAAVQAVLGVDGPVNGFIEHSLGGAGDVADVSMHIDDWVAGQTGSVNSSGVRDVVAEHIDRGRVLRFIVWRVDPDPSDSDQYTWAQGTNKAYRIVGFVTMRIHGYKFSQGGSEASWALAEFISWDNSCGQVNRPIN